MNMKYLREDVARNETNYFLYSVAIIVNLTSFLCGLAFAWSSPVAPKLANALENPLGVAFTEEEISWLASLMPLGAGVGPFVGGYLANKIGRRRTFMVSTTFIVSSYLLLSFGNSFYIFCFARFIKGIYLGISLTVVPMYVGEVAEVHNRGILGCFTVFFLTIGTLYGYTIGPYVSVLWFNLSSMPIIIIFFVAFTLVVPESPCYLILINKHNEARKSLMKLRHGDVEIELQEIIAIVKESMAAKGGIVDILMTKHLFKALYLSMGLLIIQQLTAISVIILYMQLIFESSGSNISPDVSVIIVGVVQVMGTFASTIVVDKLGRRPLLLSSTIATSLNLFILSLYFYLSAQIDVSNITWLPIISLMVYIFFYNIGIGPLAFGVMGEIFPPHVKSTASSLSVSCCYICSFVAAKLFPVLGNAMGNWFAFLVFAIGNSGGVAFIWFCLPETKGKTLSEIMELLK